MTLEEYDQVRKEHPWLRMPHPDDLHPVNVENLRPLDRESLIASRAKVILLFDYIDERGFPHFFEKLG